MRKEARDYGDVVWKKLEIDGILGGREDFERIAKGSVKAKENFARAWLKYKGRAAVDAGLDPRWSEGLLRLTEHVKNQGFGGVVLLIDEFLLWLAEKSGNEFVQQINYLNVVVDHTGGQRALPIFLFVARQRNLQEFFPDMVGENKIHEHLDHHAKRFEVTKLQDVELRHIVKGRVLKPRDRAVVAETLKSLAEKHEKVLPALLSGADIGYLKDVYPFHPALIEMLVDVTSLMQRERSALRLLYELLVVHYPGLPLGEFLPVGSAFAAIFPEAGVEASQKVDLMKDIHQQYYMRLLPAIRQLELPDAARRRALDQLVKTVLLAEVSPRLKQGGMMVERLVQLNEVDVDGETFRGQVGPAYTDLAALSQQVPDLQVKGTGRTAEICYVLGRVSFSELVARARAKSQGETQRFDVFWGALKKALEFVDKKGFEEGGLNEGEYELTWRKTKRKGAVKFGNVREMEGDDFVPPEGTFKVLLDYPWDKDGHSVDEDRHKAAQVRKNKGALYTACWLPRHLSSAELGILTELSAVKYLASGPGQEDLLGTLGASDKSKVLEQAGIRRAHLEAQLEELLKEVYIQHGEFYGLISEMESRVPRGTLIENLEHVATLLMDRRYPQHPPFRAEPKKADLELLLKWMVDAGDTHASLAFDEATGKVLRSLGEPLELVNLGQSKASLRLDTRYIKDVLSRVDKDVVSWTGVVEHLRDTYGLPSLVIDMFLCFLCQRDHRALTDDTMRDPVEVKLGMPVSARIQLQRGKVLGVAEWGHLRDLGHVLLGVDRPASHRSLQSQDKFFRSMKEKARAKRDVVQQVQEQLRKLGAGDSERVRELGEVYEKLGVLLKEGMDSYEGLGAFLGAFPEEARDVRGVIERVGEMLAALAVLDKSGLINLEAAREHAVLGGDLREHLSALEARLVGPERLLPLSEAWVRGWNKQTQGLIQRLVGHSVEKVKAPVEDVRQGESIVSAIVQRGEGENRLAGGSFVLVQKTLSRPGAEEIAALISQIRKALEAHSDKTLSVLVRVEEKSE